MINSVTLEATAGPFQGEEVVLNKGQSLTVGRAQKADVAAGDPYMSGSHFSIECDGETAKLKDLGSRHGTLVNNQQAHEVILQEGDKILCGQTLFVVHLWDVAPDAKLRDTIKVAESQPKSNLPVEAPTLADPAGAVAAPKRRNRPREVPEIPATASPVPPVGNVPLTRPVTPGVSDRKSGALIAQAESQVSTPTGKISKPLVERPTPSQRAPSKPVAEEHVVMQALELSMGASREGRLNGILKSQPIPLFALLDAAGEPSVPDLLAASGSRYMSLYDGDSYSNVAPYLVTLEKDSKFINQLVREGWGNGWIVFLTCGQSLEDLRNYYRSALMIKMPDGREFFSRFYDPVFFRKFLDGYSAAEADRFFGPVSSFLMESENPDILLEFTKGSSGAEVRERLLLISGT